MIINIKKTIIYTFLIMLFIFPLDVLAYIKVESEPLVNSFTLGEAPQCDLTRRYYYVDENDNRQVAKASVTQTYYCGSTITLN